MKDIEKLGKINVELQKQINKWRTNVDEWTGIYNRTGSTSSYASLLVAKQALESLLSVISLLTQR